MMEEAERRGYSVNALIGHIFDRYLTGDRFYDSADVLVMNGETVNEFLMRLDISEINEIGDVAGQARIKSDLMQRGKRINFENIKWYISQVLGENKGWYRCDVQETGKDAIFHLTHSRGFKWSVFIESFITAAISESLSLKCNTVRMNNAVNIQITRE